MKSTRCRSPLPATVAAAGLFLGLLLSIPTSTASAGQLLDAAQIAHRARTALYPDLPSTRTMSIAVRTADDAVFTWTARQARKNVGGRPSVLTVLDRPESVAGIAILAEALDENMDAQWVYIPPIHRVRRLVYEGRFENFLGTDLSIEDFGFADIHSAQLTLLGQVEYEGEITYVLREVPLDPSGYSKILSWVSAESYLPRRREFFDADGVLWKTQRYEHIAVIDGVATPLRMSVVNEQEGGSTELTVRGVNYAAELDDGLFRPAALPSMLNNAGW
ncbi:MAG: outer membrane lipoprotein-sorting protein [Deltaproteobacteria bacterium]|nr:outer membrane lipoprotein-sorting protein [Deltaproteobacteria bacterium]